MRAAVSHRRGNHGREPSNAASHGSLQKATPEQLLGGANHRSEPQSDLVTWSNFAQLVDLVDVVVARWQNPAR